MRFHAVLALLAFFSVAAASANSVDTASTEQSVETSSLQKRTLWLNPSCWFGNCIDTTSDPKNCGSIGRICPSSFPFGIGGGQCVNSVCVPKSCESGCLLHLPSASCVPVSNDPNNCGSVGNKCSMPNALSNGCVSGSCVAQSCASGYDLVGGKCIKRINLMADNNNCGTLGIKCPSSFLNGIGSQCKDGICQPISCNSGCLWHQPSGECKDVSSDKNNCGLLGKVCAFPNGSGSCKNGQCQLDSCSSGFTKTNGQCLWLDLQNDCDNCGTAGQKCQYDNGVAQCQWGKCSLKNCNPGYQQVGQSCQKVDTNSDPQNCGSLGFRCPSSYLNGGSPVCQNGKCTTNCNAGWLFDWGLNFCRRVDNDCNNCGAVGKQCHIDNGTPSCNNGVCGLASCNPGFKPVNGKCQPVDTQNDSNNCGLTGKICPAKYDNGGIGVCILAKCTTLCNSGFDFDWSGNFCRDVRTDPQNCGACGTKCQIDHAVATTCQWGKCKATACETGYELQSDGTCKQIDTNTNPNHCGWFGNCCTFTPQGATGTCRNGQCITTYCPPPYFLNGNSCSLSPSGKARLAKKAAVPEKRTLCPADEEACPISGSSSFSTSFTQQFASLDNVISPGGYECIDTRTALDSCGGCASTGAGIDCNAIPNSAGVGCDNGTCVVFSCSAGFRPSLDGSSCVRTSSGNRGNNTASVRRHLQNKLNQRASSHHHS